MGLGHEVPVTSRGGIPVSSFDVRVFAIRRRPGPKTFEVRWRAAGRDRSRSFMTRALADGYRAELVRAARTGLAFALGTGEPESWAVPEPEPVTLYQHAAAYAEMKWPHLAPHSRASLADALATVTPLLTRETGRRPMAAGSARPATPRARPPSPVFPQLRSHLMRSLPRRGDGRIRPTHGDAMRTRSPSSSRSGRPSPACTRT